MDELTIASAQPFPYKMPSTGRVALIMIDWQRDFLDEGGFGHALGNDVSTLRRGLGPAAAVLTAARACGVPIVHTLEAHKPDLSDLPAAKLLRCPAIGKVLEAEPARGRLLIAGEPGNAIVDEVAPIAGELVLHKPGKGAFCGTALHEELRARGVTHLLVTGVTTEVCMQSTPAGSSPWPVHPTQQPGEVPRHSATSALESDHPISRLYLHFISPTSPLYLPSSPRGRFEPRFEPIGTLREANDRGYDCLVVSDATESYFPRLKQATLEMVVAQGAIVGWAALSSEVVAALRAHAPMPPPSAAAAGALSALAFPLPPPPPPPSPPKRVLLAVSGTLQDGFELRGNLDHPEASALLVGSAVCRGVKVAWVSVCLQPMCPGCNTQAAQLCNPTCLRPTSTSRRRGAASTAARPTARRASTQPMWSRATGETPTCTPSTSCTRRAP